MISAWGGRQWVPCGGCARQVASAGYGAPSPPFSPCRDHPFEHRLASILRHRHRSLFTVDIRQRRSPPKMSSRPSAIFPATGAQPLSIYTGALPPAGELQASFSFVSCRDAVGGADAIFRRACPPMPFALPNGSPSRPFYVSRTPTLSTLLRFPSYLLHLFHYSLSPFQTPLSQPQQR